MRTQELVVSRMLFATRLKLLTDIIFFADQHFEEKHTHLFRFYILEGRASTKLCTRSDTLSTE